MTLTDCRRSHFCGNEMIPRNILDSSKFVFLSPSSDSQFVYKLVYSAIGTLLPGADLLENLSLEKLYCLFTNNFFGNII